MARKSTAVTQSPEDPAPKESAQENKPLKKRVQMIRVVATQMGYYEHRRRRPGAVFDIPEVKRVAVGSNEYGEPVYKEVKQFSRHWMQRVSVATPIKEIKMPAVIMPPGSRPSPSLAKAMRADEIAEARAEGRKADERDIPLISEEEPDEEIEYVHAPDPAGDEEGVL